MRFYFFAVLFFLKLQGGKEKNLLLFSEFIDSQNNVHHRPPLLVGDAARRRTIALAIILNRFDRLLRSGLGLRRLRRLFHVVNNTPTTERDTHGQNAGAETLKIADHSLSGRCRLLNLAREKKMPDEERGSRSNYADSASFCHSLAGTIPYGNYQDERYLPSGHCILTYLFHTGDRAIHWYLMHIQISSGPYQLVSV